MPPPRRRPRRPERHQHADYQFRTIQWLQGKTWEKSTPFGPALVTKDEFTPGPLMTSAVDGDVQQSTPHL